MKMALAVAVAVAVCLVLHCVMMVMQKGAQGLINCSDPSLIIWKKYV